jgi:hypothetical protein
VRKIGVLVLALAAASVLLAGCSGDDAGQASARAAAQPRCLDRAGWQKLANRIGAPVYCPGWMPDPLDGRIGSRWNNIDAVDPDRSYLMSWVWQETGPGAAGGELHVNLRGYPRVARIPTCTDTRVTSSGKHRRVTLPCFADAKSHRRAGPIDATIYTVNQDADQWHVLYAWKHGGSLYTLSEHVAPPLTYRKVVANLDRMLRSLVLVRPAR